MSMKFMQQLQEDHTNIQGLKNKEKGHDKKLSKLNENIIELKSEITEKLNQIIELLNKKISEPYLVREDKPKIKEIKETKEDINTFIPDIDTSDMLINSKEEKENLKDLSLKGGLDALDVLINKK